MKTPIRLGLTGGIGSGKSTVAEYLRVLGAHVIDADAISRSTTQEGGSALSEISKVFGSEFIGKDGALDRVMMRIQVFSQPKDRARLEAIIHPQVAAEMARQVKGCSSNCLVFDVPLLVESPRWRLQLDQVWVVDCTTETQIDRVESRNGWDRSTIESVIASQCSRSQRNAGADTVLFNDRMSLSALKSLVQRFATDFGL